MRYLRSLAHCPLALGSLALVFFAAPAAADQSWVGLITDTMCAQSHVANIEHAKENSGRVMTEKECTVGCVTRRGQKYVLVSDGKIYQISNQTFAGLPIHAAEIVTMTGSLSDSTITVTGIAAAPSKK